MRKNYYGRRRKINSSFNNEQHYKKHKELLDRANKTEDTVEKTKLLQQAEHYFKLANSDN